jgi:hypothetical protein
VSFLLSDMRILKANESPFGKIKEKS